MMRVLMMNAYGRITGGADKHCFDLAHLLRSAGNEVAFVTTADVANEVHDGVFVPRHVSNDTREHLALRAQLNVARRALWNRTSAVAAQTLIERWQPDLVHVHNIYPQLSVAPVVEAHRRGIPIVQTAHDYQFISATYTDPVGGRLDRAEARAAYRALNSSLYVVKRAAHVPAVAQWITVSTAAARHYGAAGLQARVLPNFVPLGSLAGASVAFQDRDGILYFGRLVAEKGVRDVIELAKAIDEPVTVMGEGPLADEVRQAASVVRNLTFVGGQPHASVQEAIRRARVVVMPSRWDEPGPLAALEAMAAGTPVITFPSGGLSEYVADAGSGEVVPADAAALASSVLRYSTLQDIWQAASDAGRRAAAGTHAPETYLERITAVYADAVSAR